MEKQTNGQMDLGQWLDRIVIAAIGVIFFWGGSQIQCLANKVGTLAETMSAVLVELRTTKETTAHLQSQIDQHIAEDRQQFLANHK